MFVIQLEGGLEVFATTWRDLILLKEVYFFSLFGTQNNCYNGELMSLPVSSWRSDGEGLNVAIYLFLEFLS